MIPAEGMFPLRLNTTLSSRTVREEQNVLQSCTTGVRAENGPS
ncbi:hypothetical protein BLSMQ_3036 [Brevibacterium aurantiacum]|uniref:Uncharacterized protein n=1 Tax=Brevibacterium aurantiacum TaxID=273384 RepID=A0A1D7W7X6_BREAU|nr:hypothetical protein BLSMQ_3036 [Brevibacterium aurantiacum]